MKTSGIHHISAIVGHPQETVDFYSDVLGLRLVKKTINFDDPRTYHLYFGNKDARPGSIITFFPWIDAHQGRIGGGQVGATIYAVPTDSLNFWEKRLADKNISFDKTERFSETFLQFEDPHGLRLELVERKEGPLNSWSNDGVSPETAVKGFGGAILYSTDPQETIKTLTETMGLYKQSENEQFIRLKADGDIGDLIDVKREPERLGRMGVGTVHHIAWRAHNETDHKNWQILVSKHGHQITEIKDRKYFKSIYFREPGHILFEIASDGPGFTVDESPETLGRTLKLPYQYEEQRNELEQQLVPLITD